MAAINSGIILWMVRDSPMLVFQSLDLLVKDVDISNMPLSLAIERIDFLLKFNDLRESP